MTELNPNERFYADLEKLTSFVKGEGHLGLKPLGELTVDEMKDLILTCGKLSMSLTEIAVILAGVMRQWYPDDFKEFKAELLSTDGDEAPIFGDDDDKNTERPF